MKIVWISKILSKILAKKNFNQTIQQRSSISNGNSNKKIEKIFLIPYFALDGLFNDTTHNSLRWIYRSAKIDWTKKPSWVYSSCLPTKVGVGTIK